MRLLIVSHACITPINQRFFADVSRVTGWDVSILMPSRWTTEYGKECLPERSAGFSGNLLTVPIWKCGNIPLHAYKSMLTGLLRKAQPDAIYVHHEPYALATFQFYIANRMSVRRPIGFYAAQNIRKDYPVPFRWFERLVFAQSSFAFPVSQGALEVLREKGYRHRAEVLPLAVDLDVYQPRPQWGAAKRMELGIRSSDFVIGYVGRLVEEKGLASLLRSLGQLPETGWHCVLVGSGPMETELRELARTLGIADRVRFIGFVQHEEAAKWFSLFDAFALTSKSRSNWKEQFGRVIVEANACGVPVVGTESGEIGNVIRATGGGVVVREDNDSELAAALRSLMSDAELRRRLGNLGENAVRDRFEQTHLAGRFAASIEQGMRDTAR